MLQPNPKGHYHFLTGIDPYSCGVIAKPGFEIVHVRLVKPVPWRDGFHRVDGFLRRHGRQRVDLCAMELRCPQPHTMESFIAFNSEYCSVLKEWGLYVDGLNPLARTNVAPLREAPSETMLFAFSYTRPNPTIRRQTLIIAGAGELGDGGKLDADGIVRRGETTPDALHEKSRFVLDVMLERLKGIGASEDAPLTIDVYTTHPIHSIATEALLSALPAANLGGVHWYLARPPVVDIEFEMDLRSVEEQLTLDLTA